MRLYAEVGVVSARSITDLTSFGSTGVLWLHDIDLRCHMPEVREIVSDDFLDFQTPPKRALRITPR
jgi:hypothetical protein